MYTSWVHIKYIRMMWYCLSTYHIDALQVMKDMREARKTVKKALAIDSVSFDHCICFVKTLMNEISPP